MAVCEAHGCTTELTVGNTSGLCYVCSSGLAHDQHELENDIDKVLGREAAFQAWCLAHGLPDPHK